MSSRQKNIDQEKLGLALCELLLNDGRPSLMETAIRQAQADTLRAVLGHIVHTGDGDNLISQLIDLPAERRAIRAILKLAIHLIDCHRPE